VDRRESLPRCQSDPPVLGVALARRPEPKNLTASVRQKLFDLARSRSENVGLMLVKYGLERIVYRLSRSKHRDAIVLKGALLIELWTQLTYRATRDADFLARDY
jgi:hypothetical protein